MKKHIHVSADLDGFFSSEIRDVCKKQGLHVSEFTSEYVGRVLSRFAQSDAMFQVENLPNGNEQRSLPLFAKEYLESFHDSPQQAFFKFQHLGDLALFLTGFFPERLERNLLDCDYFAAIGQKSYAQAGILRERITSEAALNVYFELSERFKDLREAVSELADRSLLNNDVQILKLYEKFLVTQNPRIQRMLAEAGVIASSKKDQA